MKQLLWFALISAAGFIVAWLSLRRMVGLAPRRRLLLGVVRGLFVLLLAAVAAGPVAIREISTTSPAPVLVAIDTSASMALPDCRDGLTRAAYAQQRLLEPGGLLDRLARSRRVEVYQFSDICLPLASRHLSPSGQVTDFHCMLRQMRAEAKRSGAAAVVVVSDGVDTVGLRADEAGAAAFGLPPVFGVLVGGERPLDDTALRAVSCPVRVKAGSPARVTCTLSRTGRPAQAMVSWRTTTGAAGKLPVAFTRSGSSKVTFTFTPMRPGHHRLEVRVVTSAAPDLLPADDAVAVGFQVLPAERRVVLLAGAPAPEIAALRRLFARVEGIKVSAAVKKAPRDGWWLEVPELRRLASLSEIPGFSAASTYIIANVSADDLPAAVWQQVVSRTRLGEAALCLLGGPKAAKLPRQVQAVLPAAVGQYEPRAVRAAIPSSGVLGLRRDLWANLPALAGVNALGSLARGARTAIKTSDGSALVVLREDRDIRSAIVATDSSFRWVFSAAATDISRQAFQDLWLKLLAWLLRPRPPRALTLLPDRLTALDGESIMLTAYTSSNASAVDVEIYRGGQRIKSMKMRRREAGLFELAVSGLEPGQYVVRARATDGRKKLAADEVTVRVASASREWRWPRPRAALLEAVAESTGGRVIGIDDVERLTEILPAGSQTRRLPRRFDPARGIGAGLVLMVLLATDWLLRRRWGLI